MDYPRAVAELATSCVRSSSDLRIACRMVFCERE